MKNVALRPQKINRYEKSYIINMCKLAPNGLRMLWGKTWNKNDLFIKFFQLRCHSWRNLFFSPGGSQCFYQFEILRVCLCWTAEVYMGMSKPAEATACTQEAANLFPTSHNVLYMRGQIAELRGNIDEAKRWYEEALSINPTHVKTMQRLVRHSVLHLPACSTLTPWRVLCVFM